LITQGGKGWDEIANEFRDRSPTSVRRAWTRLSRHLHEPAVTAGTRGRTLRDKKGDILRQYIPPSETPRYLPQHPPPKKTPWTLTDYAKLGELASDPSIPWEFIAEQFKGRTISACKTAFHRIANESYRSEHIARL